MLFSTNTKGEIMKIFSIGSYVQNNSTVHQKNYQKPMAATSVGKNAVSFAGYQTTVQGFVFDVSKATKSIKDGKVIFTENVDRWEFPSTITTIFDEATGKFVKRIEQAKYKPNNPYQAMYDFYVVGMSRPSAQPRTFSREAAEMHKIETTIGDDGNIKTVYDDLHSRSCVEYTGSKDNQTVEICQWPDMYSNRCDTVTLNSEQMQKIGMPSLPDATTVTPDVCKIKQMLNL